MNRAQHIFTVGALFFLFGCSTAPSTPYYAPEGDWTERIQHQENEGIKVSAAVPSAKEVKELFGKALYKQGIQPVWLEISNSSQATVNFFPVGLDPLYYTPLEVAHTDLKDKNKKNPTKLVDVFYLDQGMGALQVKPGESREGLIFSKLDEGTKAFNVDIISTVDETGMSGFQTFTFFIPVPGLKIDHYNVDWSNLYSDDEWVDLDEDQLIELVENMACCVTDKKGEGSGDPLNLVVIGKPDEVYTAFIRAGWDETETVTSASTMKTIASFLSGGEYRYSPISGLYALGRSQDVAFQKARDNIHERNHLRLWMSRARFEGIPVFIGQISRDIGVRFTTKTITTHKIDPNVDETREYLLEDLAYSQSLKKFAYLGGVGEVPIDDPKGNLTGDPWFSDGYRIVLWVSSKPVSIDDVDFVNWRTPYRGSGD